MIMTGATRTSGNIFCPKCGAAIPLDLPRCSECGSSVTLIRINRKPKRKQTEMK
ncbi:MAG: hypothetical protein PUH33_02780 [Clostridiaceae bacterium]|nr:hypothetical protein [Clostridiaceae bacterium]MDO4495735.1 hypothetical protein [Clostridiaceae bacterium]